MISVEWEFLVGEAKRMGIPLEEMVAGLENDPYYIIVGKPDLCHCGKPEAQHIWISESELTLWRPEPGFKKNSCARRPSSDYTVEEPKLIFKVWSPPEDPCDVGYMEDIST
jgi:hypothetical protein